MKRWFQKLLRIKPVYVPVAFKRRWSDLDRKIMAIHMIGAEHRSAL